MTRLTVLLVSFLFLGLTATPQAMAEEGASVGTAFIEAFDKKDAAAMKEIIKARGSEVPAEVKAMVEYATSPGASPQEQDFLFDVAGTMAQLYSKQVGDDRLLSDVTQNYQSVLDKRKGQGGEAVSKGAEDQVKKKLMELGKGQWRITVFKVDAEGKLDVEIDVKESSGEEMAKVETEASNEAMKIVKKHLPSIKGGKILWSSAGTGLKTVDLEQGEQKKINMRQTKADTGKAGGKGKKK